MKIVQKISRISHALKDAAALLRFYNKVNHNAMTPRGVYRFKTFNEADEWMITMMARTHVRQKSKIS